MVGFRQVGPAVALVAALVFPGAAEDLAKLREKLARETDPADRAKITVDIGEELLKRASRQYKDEAYDEGDQLLNDYKQAMRAAYDDLMKTGRDARRKPKGFKHLEIHLRKGRRRLEDLARVLPYDQRTPVYEAIEEVEALRGEILGALMGLERNSPAGDAERK